MDNSKEKTKFLELFRKLDFEKTKEFCCIVKGMVFINSKQKGC